MIPLESSRTLLALRVAVASLVKLCILGADTNYVHVMTKLHHVATVSHGQATEVSCGVMCQVMCDHVITLLTYA